MSESFDDKEIIVKLRDLLILAGGVAAATHASALTLGNTQGNVQLGSALDLVFHVQADPGQTVQSSCVSADIWMGDTALNSSQVVLTAQDKSVRIRTTTPVFEPLITLKLSAGCAGAISRSYTFFADPPRNLAASVQPIDLSKIQVSSVPVAPRVSAPVAQSEKPVRAAKRPVNPKAFKDQPAASANAAVPAALTSTAAADAPSAATPDTPADFSSPIQTAAEAEKPRLRIEPIEGFDSPPTTRTPASSADHTVASLNATNEIDEKTQLLLNTNASRLEAMEQQLQALQQQLSRNRSEITGLQTQLVQAQNPDLPVWVQLMLGLLALALAAIAWLIQRIKQERVNAKSAWADTVLAVEDSERATTIDTRANASNTSSMTLRTSSDVTEITSEATAPIHPNNSDEYDAAIDDKFKPAHHQEFEALQPVTPTSANAHAIAEVLTAQALFDVQEQAEFYASIGENDQAIAVLQSHIADNEASSPLAYIELLQLLYRLSRTEAYEQVREQFQAHFNVQVPDFLSFARKGRDLWSGHPDVLGQIEALWPTDDVQNLLRGLILRRNTPDAVDSSIRFDLAAFDDLLMLYNVAKTTPPASRGQLPGRTRTAPTEAPLPEFVLDQASFALNSANTTQTLNSPPPAPAPLPLADAYLDLLSAGPSQTPLATKTATSDSPFQTPNHFTPNEALMEGLSLNWEETLHAPTASSIEPQNKHLMVELDAELEAFMMDERDLPQDQRLSKKI